MMNLIETKSGIRCILILLILEEIQFNKLPLLLDWEEILNIDLQWWCKLVKNKASFLHVVDRQVK